MLWRICFTAEWVSRVIKLFNMPETVIIAYFSFFFLIIITLTIIMIYVTVIGKW